MSLAKTRPIDPLLYAAQLAVAQRFAMTPPQRFAPGETPIRAGRPQRNHLDRHPASECTHIPQAIVRDGIGMVAMVDV